MFTLNSNLRYSWTLTLFPNAGTWKNTLKSSMQYRQILASKVTTAFFIVLIFNILFFISFKDKTCKSVSKVPSFTSLESVFAPNTQNVEEIRQKSSEKTPKVINCSHYETIPSSSKHKVTALASFMGSGNTWTRHLIHRASGYWTGSIYYDTALRAQGMIPTWNTPLNCGTVQNGSPYRVVNKNVRKMAKKGSKWLETTFFNPEMT